MTPEQSERIAALRRQILERHPDAAEVNARVRAALNPGCDCDDTRCCELCADDPTPGAWLMGER